MSFCSFDDIVDSMKDRPALLMTPIKTIPGMIVYLFFLILSFMGLKQLSGQSSLFSIFSREGGKITNTISDKVKGAFNIAQSGATSGYLFIYLFTFLGSFLGLWLFSDRSVTWITIGLAIVFVAVLLSFLLNSMSEESNRTKLVSSGIGGIVTGTGLAIIVIIITTATEWFTGDLLLDFFFMFTLVYVLLSSIVLIRSGKNTVQDYLYSKTKNWMPTDAFAAPKPTPKPKLAIKN